MYFEKRIDLRSRQAMVEFLSRHFRYHTMNSWNRSTSYANCIKINQLGLASEMVNRAYDVLRTDFWSLVDHPIESFTAEQGHSYTIGTTGRSGGYLVLYQSSREPTGHKSYCQTCGQRNFKSVVAVAEGVETLIATEIIQSGGAWHEATYLLQPAIKALDLPEAQKLQLIERFKRELKDATLDNCCGRCHAEGEEGRKNFATPPMHLIVRPGQGMDQGEDFSEWSMDGLRRRVELVTAFDRACDAIRAEFIDLTQNSRVVEETVMVPTKVTVLRPLEEAMDDVKS